MKQFYNFFSNAIRLISLSLCVFLSLESVSQAQIELPKIANEATKENGGIPGDYIVVYKSNSKVATQVSANPSVAVRKQLMQQEVTSTLAKNNVISKEVTQVYETVIKGFAVRGLTSAGVAQLRKDDQIDYVVPDTPVYPHVGNVAQPTLLAGDCNLPSITFNGVVTGNVGLASFGSTNVATGELVRARNSAGNPVSGCDAVANNLSGKIALIDMGACNYSQQAYNAQLAGAVGVILVYNLPGNAPGMGAGANAALVTIPVMSVTQELGLQVKTELTNGTTVNAIVDPAPVNPAVQCKPWGIARVNGGSSGAGKRAWVIDTGVDSDHPDLNVDTDLWKSFLIGNTSPEDESGHGTHVAGTIAALDNTIGVIGVAAGAKVIAVRVFAATGGSATSIIIAGMNYVAANAVFATDVVNMSLGGDANRAYEQAVINLSLKSRVVISAGNDGRDANYNTPARINAPNVYTISAMDKDDKLASFSNFGNAPVDYAAPGVRVSSCWLNGGYAYLNGTSMASPHVAGLLLLGDICSSSRVTGDPDGRPDPIAVHVGPGGAANADGDNFTICQGDPDDSDATVYPGAPEICGDGKDNDGDSLIDEECCPGGINGILYVNAIATGANNGTSWPNAFTTLQSALSAAKLCSQITQIWVAKGTYYPTTDQFGQTPTNSRNKTFSLQNNLAIYGGFQGNEGSGYDVAQRDFVNNKTTLSADLDQSNSLTTGDAYHVFLNIPVYPLTLNATAVLDGVVVRGGVANVVINNAYSYPNGNGAGMLNYSASPTIRNCSFEGNLGGIGGAVYNSGSNATFTNTLFLTNQSVIGGGINSVSSDIIVSNCSFNGNSAANFGGGIYSESSSLTVTNSSFQLNTASTGGGIENAYGTISVTNSSFSGNRGTSSGGAINNYGASTSVIKNSIFWGNNTEVRNETGEPAGNPTISYSIIQGGWSGQGSDNLNVNPKFVTQPVVGSTVIGNLSLQNCSPAINSSDPSTTSATVGTMDLAGNARLFNALDRGAYEFQTESVYNPTLAADPGLGMIPGESITLTVSAADAYLWSTTATTAAITVSPAANTTYTVTATNGICSKLLTAAITVGPPTWNGSQSTDWNIAANWASGAVPRATHDVVIPSSPGNQPVIGTAAIAKSVVVNAGASLAITASTGSLAINESTGNGFTNNGTVTNAGALKIGNTGNIGTHGISNFGTFTNSGQGTIDIDRFHDKGILNELITPNYSNTFTNNGKIRIGFVAGNNFGIENVGTFVNAVNGTSPGSIDIPSANNSGIHNVGPFFNSGPITIKSVLSGGPGRGIFNQNAFTNNSGGTVTVDRSLFGILNEGPLTNYGKINIGATESVTTGINSSNTFDNNGCLAIITTNAIITNTSSFTNSGAIIENANGNGGITSNSGVVQNLNGGTFSIGTNTGINTTNTGTITQPNRLTVAVTPASQSISSGQTVTLTASGGTSYTWSNASTANPLVIIPGEGQTTYTVTGLTGFCTGTGTAQVTTTALPVTLISFEAKKQSNGSVKLAWVTANEVNNEYFELERSIDLKKVELLTRVGADEKSASTHLYSFTDELPHQGTSYYRLRQVDFNGEKTTYGWVSVVVDQVYTVYPNPVVQNQFRLQLDEPGKAAIKFYSLDGKPVPLQTVNRGSGMMDLKMPKNSSSGIYLLQVEERGQIRNYRVMVE